VSVWTKLAARSLRCTHCRRALRLRLAPTVPLSFVVFGAILVVLLRRGVNRGSLGFAAGCLLGLLLAYLLMPLALRGPDAGGGGPRA
jgi:hypothetical protein